MIYKKQLSASFRIHTVLAVLFLSHSNFASGAKNSSLGVRPGASSAGTVAVLVEPANSQDNWTARALEYFVLKSVSTDKLIPASSTAALLKCAPQDRSCLMEAARGLKIDALMLGRLSQKGRFDYKIFEPRSSSLVSSGHARVDTRGTLSEIIMSVRRAMRPFVEKGGRLDSRPSDLVASSSEVSNIEKVSNLTDLGFLRYPVWVLFPLLLVVPEILGAILGILRQRKRKRKLELKEIFSPWLRWSFVIFGAALLAKYLLGSFFGSGFSDGIIKLDSAVSRILALVAGIVGGLFILTILKIVTPTVSGFAKISHWNIVKIIRAWCFVFIMRSLTFLVWISPVAALMYAIYSKINFLPPVLTWLLVPSLGLLAAGWLKSWLEVLCRTLDNRFYTLDPESRNYWDAHIRRYFVGYAKTVGLKLDERVLEMIEFLPSPTVGSSIYGGGFSRTRILIERRLVETAIEAPGAALIAELNMEMRDPISGALFANVAQQKGLTDKIKKLSQWNVGPVATGSFSQFGTNVNMAVQKPGKRYATGQEDMVYGLILPRRNKDTAPLIADHDEDLDTLNIILAEHNPRVHVETIENLEYDDLGPKSKDFLFGLLLCEYGRALRHEELASTLLILANIWTQSWMGWPLKLKHFIRSAYHYVYAQYPRIIHDSFVALNGGLPHLAQALEFQRTNRSKNLTTRARQEDLRQSAWHIFSPLQTYRSTHEERVDEESTWNRLVWLSQFQFSPLPRSRHTRLKQWSLTVSIMFLGMLAANEAHKAVSYHPGYLAKIDLWKQSKEQEKENGTKK